jgi:hypothetical protein
MRIEAAVGGGGMLGVGVGVVVSLSAREIAWFRLWF